MSFENFIRLARRLNIITYLKNSAIYAIGTAIPSVLINAMAGYAFARLHFKGRNVLFVLTLATMMIPFQVIMIPLFLIVNKMGMYDNYLGLILPKLAAAVGIFMMRAVFSGIPKELEEAGRIDGVSEFGLFFKITDVVEVDRKSVV